MKQLFSIIFVFAFISLTYSQTDLAKMDILGLAVLSETEIVAKRLSDGRFCSGIKVISDVEGFSYDTYLGVIGFDDKLGQDILYLDPTERVLLIYHVGYEPLKIFLSEMGIELKEKQMWEIKIRAGKVDKIPVSFLLIPKDAEVTIDGKNMGSGPTFQLTMGKHNINIKKQQHYTLEDIVDVNPNNLVFKYHLGIRPAMVFVEGGKFTMGSNDVISKDHEKPVHKISLNSFFIGKYEVTFEEYDIFCEATGKEKEGDYGWGREKRPIINVSWYDVVEYCNWLSEQEGLTPCYDIDKNKKDPNNVSSNDELKWLVQCNFNVNGYRLPTEAEWEYACRGGRRSHHYQHSGSDILDEVAWYYDNSDKKTHPVGIKQANELGIYDMNGNVNEWCWDWYDDKYYSNSPSKNPNGAYRGLLRVSRGGDWFYYGGFNCYSSSRIPVWPGYRSEHIGIRLCKTK